MRFISRTDSCYIGEGLTFVGYWHHLVLGIGVLQDALRAEHLLIAFAEELHLFLLVGVAVLDAAAFFRGSRGACPRGGAHLSNGQRSENRVVDWQALSVRVVSHLVERALDDLVLADLPQTLKTEGVAARERKGLLFVVVVLLEADAAFKYRVHLFIRIKQIV